MNERGSQGRSGMGQSALLGAASQILGRGGRALVGLVTVAILSRFMGPTEFGIAALILFLTMFAQIFSDFGLRLALVQKSTINELELNSVFWFTFATGCLVSASVYFGAGLIAELLKEPAVEPYVRWVSWIFLVTTMRGVPLALLERSFRFPTIAWSELVGAVVGGFAAVVAAWQGYTVGALVLQQILMAVVPTLLNLLSARWLPQLRFSFEALRPLASFGATTTVTAVVGFLAGNLDRPLLATRLSPKDLGLYAMAGQLVGTPLRVVATSARRVTFPILASIQNENARIVTAQRSSLHAMMVLLAPISMGLASLSGPIVSVFLGPAWGAVAPIMAVSAITSLIWSIGELNISIFSARGAVRLMLFLSLYAALSTVVLLTFAAPFGLMAIVWLRLAWTIFDTFLHCWLLSRLLNCRVADLIGPLWRPLLAAGLMGALVMLLDARLEGMRLAPIVRLAAGVPVGAILYGVGLLLIDRARVLELVARVRNRRAAPPAA